MANASSSITLMCNVFFICLTIAISLYAHKLFRSLPIGLSGDIIVSVIAIAAFATYLQTGWDRMLLQLNDDYPIYFRLAYMPWVAFVAIGFVRSLMPLIPASMMPQAVAMTSMTPGPLSSGPGPGATTPDPPPAAKPQSKLMRWTKVTVAILLLGVLAVVYLAKFMTRNDLPYCDSQVALETLSSIFKGKSIDVKRYDTEKTLSTSPDLVTCAASLTLMTNGKADIEYSIYRDSGNVQVKITKAVDK